MSVSSASVRKAHPVTGWLFSSLGKKIIVAVTGILLVLFLFGHLAGNLTFFGGPDWINSYAVHLHDLGPLLWVARIGLLVIVGLHIFFTMKLWQENMAARPQKYAVKHHVKASVFARTMRVSGLVIIAFVLFHIAHFTTRVIYPEVNAFRDAAGRFDVYHMMIVGFSNPLISGFYIFSLALIAFHLSHGIGSLFQTLGLSNAQLQPRLTALARVVAWILFIGFASIPASVLLGLKTWPSQ